MRAGFLIALCSFMSSGCATLAKAPTPEQVAVADYGSAPTKHEELIRAYFKDRLYDPFTAQYEFSAPRRGWRSSTLTPPIFGWRVMTRVNAKNRMGGYVGWHSYAVLLRGDSIVDVADEDLNKTIYDASGDGPEGVQVRAP